MNRVTFLMVTLTFSLVSKAQEVKTDSLSYDNNGVIDSIFQSLPEVMIKGDRPVVKAEVGKLVYDLPRMIEEKPVENIYDALKELPGVAEMNENITLRGQSVTIVLDGKVTTMSNAQLMALLKSMPVSRIKHAEVMYNAPARYQVRGAMINIQLKHEKSEIGSVKGELFGQYTHESKNSFQERVSLLANKGKLSADFLYTHNHGEDFTKADVEARHQLNDGTIHEIQTHSEAHQRSHTHAFRAGFDYNFDEKHQLSLVYNGSFGPSHSVSGISGWLTSTSRYDNQDYLHNGRLDYQTPFGLKTGLEFTYYKAPSTQILDSRMPEQQLDYLIHNDQKINKWKGFITQEHQLKNDWGINYGVIYTNTLDNSYQYYTKTHEASSDLPVDLTVRQREHILNIYGGFNHNFSSKLVVDFSLAAEYYKSKVWSQWDFYPNLNLTWLPSDEHTFQLGFSSNKGYPDYWSVSAFTAYNSVGYGEITGNPRLKPRGDYQVELTYILRNKYTISAWYNYTDDHFAQTLYQHGDRLVQEYRFLNFDFRQQIGLQASIPFKVGKWLNSRATLIGVWTREKDSDFYDIPFDRKIVYGMFNLRNTITFSKKPDISLGVNAYARTKATQGTYDLPASGNLEFVLRYKFMNGKASLNLFAQDVFETSMISPQIRYANQWVKNSYSCYRQLGLSFKYTFGGYKEKNREAVDTSRFK